MSLLDLPNEVLLQIIQKLPPGDLVAAQPEVSKVCKRLASLHHHHRSSLRMHFRSLPKPGNSQHKFSVKIGYVSPLDQTQTTDEAIDASWSPEAIDDLGKKGILPADLKGNIFYLAYSHKSSSSSRFGQTKFKLKMPPFPVAMAENLSELRLSIKGCCLLEPWSDGLADVLKQCPQLAKLRLETNQQALPLPVLSKYNRKLRSLHVKAKGIRWRLLKDDWNPARDSLPMLEEIDLVEHYELDGFYVNVQDKVDISVRDQWPAWNAFANLKRLQLTMAKFVASIPDLVEVIAESCPLLENLGLCFMPEPPLRKSIHVYGEGGQNMRKPGVMLPNLKALALIFEVRERYGNTKATTLRILDMAPNLEELDFFSPLLDVNCELIDRLISSCDQQQGPKSSQQKMFRSVAIQSALEPDYIRYRRIDEYDEYIENPDIYGINEIPESRKKTNLITIAFLQNVSVEAFKTVLVASYKDRT